MHFSITISQAGKDRGANKRTYKALLGKIQFVSTCKHLKDPKNLAEGKKPSTESKEAEPENGVDPLVGFFVLQLSDDGVASFVGGLHRRQQEHRGCNKKRHVMQSTGFIHFQHNPILT